MPDNYNIFFKFLTLEELGVVVFLFEQHNSVYLNTFLLISLFYLYILLILPNV